MNNAPVVVAVALLLMFFLVGIYDSYLLAFGVQGVTVSSVIQGWASSYPVLPFLLGVVAGHLFWPGKLV